MTEIERRLKEGVNFIPAVVCYLLQGDRVVLGLRKKVSFGLGQNLIAGIGGKRGDTPETEKETDEEAARREIEEEIRVKVKVLREMGRVRFIFPNKPKWNQDVVIFLIDTWEGEPQETEAILPSWYKLDQLPIGQMWDDNHFWLPQVLAGQKVKATFLFDEDGQKVVEYVFEE